MTALIPKDAFIGIEDVAHLAAGGEAPPLREHVAAAAEFLGDKAAGMPGRERMYATAERVRARLAALLRGEAADVAFLATASDGLFVAASGIDWPPRRQRGRCSVRVPFGPARLAPVPRRGAARRRPLSSAAF
jgi:cysteine desulfurase / selenocysteine lyase